MNRLLVISLLAAVIAIPLHAEQYWVAWEGNDYPENEGWVRFHYGDDGPAANRSLADGIMTLDGLASPQIIDSYRVDRLVNPGAGEQFAMQWRLRVNEVNAHPLSPYDPGLNVFSDDDWALTFWIGMDRILSYHEDVEIPFAPGVFHEFEVRSPDMHTYQLQIDGSVVYVGNFWEPTFQRSSVMWGDFIRGSASHTDWDYFRFGVVPEPSSLVLMIASVCAARIARRRNRATIFPPA